MSMDMQQQVARIQRLQEESRNFIAEARERAAEAHEPAAEIGKIGRPNGLLVLQVLVVAGMFAGGALVGVAVVLIKVFRP